MPSVSIRGEGVAARCCAHVLQRAGVLVDRQPVDRVQLPVVMLSENALALIRDVFDQPDLFRDAPQIRHRAVAWGPDSQTVTLDHSARVVSEQALVESIGSTSYPKSEQPEGSADWALIAARPLPAETTQHSFGTRVAYAAPVELKEGHDPETCWIESLDAGWLFLIPGAEASGYLLSVGGEADSLLGHSRLAAHLVARLLAPGTQFPAYPRIAAPLCGSGWLACGSAAMAFDPICGDGVAHAVREAILASAVIRAIQDGQATDELLDHYKARMIAGFRRHLQLCREFYKTGGAGTWWTTELNLLQRGLDWCDHQLQQVPDFQYRLEGFELYRVAAANPH